MSVYCYTLHSVHVVAEDSARHPRSSSAQLDAMESPLHRQRREYGNGQVVVQVEGLVELRECRRERAKEDGMGPNVAKPTAQHTLNMASDPSRLFLPARPSFRVPKESPPKLTPMMAAVMSPRTRKRMLAMAMDGGESAAKRSTHTCHRDKKSVDDRG